VSPEEDDRQNDNQSQYFWFIHEKRCYGLWTINLNNTLFVAIYRSMYVAEERETHRYTYLVTAVRVTSPQNGVGTEE
jgi:hypothetical protein